MFSLYSGGQRLATVEKPADKFIHDFCEQIKILNKHDFIAKKQSNHFKTQKENLTENEIIVLMDFSENLSFEIQDAIQSQYFSKSQCTLHPICIYYKVDDKVKWKSLIVIAESLKHNVEAVYQFQCKLVEYVKREFGEKKMIFFSDGAASQYKNKYNFLNICMFENEFGLKIEWNYFCTAHGKGPCDALGGAFKRRARIYNMQHPTDALDDAKSLFKWAKNNESRTEFIFCSKSDYENIYEDLNENRYHRKINTVVGTQSFHSFNPIDEITIRARPFSGSNDSTDHKLFGRQIRKKRV